MSLGETLLARNLIAQNRLRRPFTRSSLSNMSLLGAITKAPLTMLVVSYGGTPCKTCSASEFLL
jgi:hypothetical protein